MFAGGSDDVRPWEKKPVRRLVKGSAGLKGVHSTRGSGAGSAASQGAPTAGSAAPSGSGRADHSAAAGPGSTAAAGSGEPGDQKNFFQN